MMPAIAAATDKGITMKKFLVLSALVLAGVGCGQASQNAGQLDTTTTTAAPIVVPTATEVTSSPPKTTPTTICVPADTIAQQNYIDTTRGAIRQTESAIAQIQLVIDNGTRDRTSALRYQLSVQADYDKAAAAFGILGTDTARDKMTWQSDRLADAKDNVASWDAIIAKAHGDLGRGQAQKAEFERKIREVTAQIASAQTC